MPKMRVDTHFAGRLASMVMVLTKVVYYSVKLF